MNVNLDTTSVEKRCEIAAGFMCDAFSAVLKRYELGVPLPFAQPHGYALYSADPAQDSALFSPLAFRCVCADSHPVDRIGNLYSPFVGVFSIPALTSGCKPSSRNYAVPSQSLKGCDFLPLRMFCSAYLEPIVDFPLKCFWIRGDQWQECTVTSYDVNTQTYSVSTSATTPPTVARVSRGRLRKNTETEDEFNAALMLAKDDRLLCEREMRTEMFLGLIADDSANPMPIAMINRVLRSATERCIAPALVEAHVKRMKHEYATSMKLCRLRYLLQGATNRELLSPLDLGPSAFPLAPLVAAKRFPGSQSHFVSARACVEHSFRWSQATMKCMCIARHMWDKKYAKLQLFDLRSSNISYEMFMSQNYSALKAAVLMLRVQYCADVDCAMVDCLSGVFSYSHLTEDSFRSSDLGKFFDVMRVDMSRNLRDLIMRSLARFRSSFSMTGTQSVDSPYESAKFGATSDNYYRIVGVISRHPLSISLKLKTMLSTVFVEPTLSTAHSQLRDLVAAAVSEVASIQRLENNVMTSLNLPRATVPCATSSAPEVQDTLAMLDKIVNCSVPLVQEVIQAFSAFVPVPAVRPIDEYFSDQKDTSLLENDLGWFDSTIERITWTSAESVCCGAFVLDVAEAKQLLVDAWNGLRSTLIEAVEHRIADAAERANKTFAHIHGRLTKRPESAEEMQSLVAFSVEALKELSHIERKDCRHVLGWVRLLESVFHVVPQHITQSVLEMFNWPGILDEHFAKSDEMVQAERCHMIAELDNFADHIHSRIDESSTIIDELYFVSDLECADATSETIVAVRAKLDGIRRDISTLHRRQDIFELPRSNFDLLFSIQSNFESVDQFWSVVRDATYGLQTFYETPVQMLDPDAMTTKAETWRRLLRHSSRALRGFPASFALGRKTEAGVARFQEILPCIELLKSPGMRVSHWKELSRRMELPSGSEMHPSDQALTLRRLLELRVPENINVIQEIAENATKEFGIEQSLENMKNEARQLKLMFTDVGEAGVLRILNNATEIAPIVDHFLGVTQQMRNSQHVSTHLSSVLEWECMLLRLQEVLVLWTKVQDHWLQLHPVIMQSTGEDHVGSTPTRVVADYVQADSQFRGLVDEIDRTQHSITTVMLLETLPAKLTEIQSTLDGVRCDVLSVMDAKRNIFPRFFFVSDTQMLGCLSSANLDAVTPLFVYMYARLSHLEVTNNEVVAFVAADGVRLASDKPIPVSNEPIENWMLRLDRGLKTAIASNLDIAWKEYTKTHLRSWLLKWNGQFVDLVLRARFTTDLEEVVEAAGLRGLEAYLRKMHRVTAEFSNINRSRSSLKYSEAQILANAIVTEAANADVVQAAIRERISTLHELHTFPYFRTYLRTPSTNSCVIRHLMTETSYGYEFLGHTMSPIVTTELFQAMRGIASSVAVGGHSLLLGKTGYGKSELIRATAHIMGKFLWEFQCIPGVSLQSFATILRGCMRVGGWVCFEDIDLLDENAAFEVAQVSQGVASARRSSAPVQLGPSVQVSPLSKDFAIFATSRLSLDSLSDSLHPQLVESFRPSFLHQPSFTEFAKLQLCANGLDAHSARIGKKLGTLWTSLFETSRDVFTLRRLAVVIRIASLCADRSRIDAAIATAIDDFVKPALPVVLHDVLLEHLNELELAQAKSSATSMRATHQLEQCLIAFDHAIIVGPTFSGKTQVADSISNAYQQVLHVAPQCLPSSAMYGHFRTINGEEAFQPGVIDHLTSMCTGTITALILFDGPFTESDEYVWLPVLSSNRRAVCGGGVGHIVNNYSHSVFKTTSLSRATPRLIAKCGIVVVDRAKHWKDIVAASLARFTVLTTFAAHLQRTAETIVPAFEEATASALARERCGSSQCSCFVAMTMFPAVIAEALGRSISWTAANTERQPQLVFQAFVFSLVWAFGGAMCPKSREKMSQELTKIADSAILVAREVDSAIELFPSDMSLFAYRPAIGGWQPFVSPDDEIPAFDFDAAQPPWRQYFPHTESMSNVIVTDYLCRLTGVLAIGGSDAGKSTLLRRFRASTQRDGLSKIIATRLAMSHHTTALPVITSLERNVQRRKTGIFGPASGKTIQLLVDDIHLPRAHESSAGSQDAPTAVNPVLTFLSFLMLRSVLMSPEFGIVRIEDASVLATMHENTVIEDALRRAFVTCRLQGMPHEVQRTFLFALAEAQTRDLPNVANVAKEAAKFVFDGSAALRAASQDSPLALQLLLQAMKAVLAIVSSSCADDLIPKCAVAETVRVLSTGVNDISSLTRNLDTTAAQCFSSLASEATEAARQGWKIDSPSAYFVTAEDGMIDRATESDMERRSRDAVTVFNRDPPQALSIPPRDTSNAAPIHITQQSNATEGDSSTTPAIQQRRHFLVTTRICRRIFATPELLRHVAILCGHLRTDCTHLCLATTHWTRALKSIFVALHMNKYLCYVAGDSVGHNTYTFEDWCHEMRMIVRYASRPDSSIVVVVPPRVLALPASPITPGTVIGDIDVIARGYGIPPHILGEEEQQMSDAGHIQKTLSQIRFVVCTSDHHALRDIVSSFPGFREMVPYVVDADDVEVELRDLGTQILSSAAGLADQAAPLADICTTFFSQAERTFANYVVSPFTESSFASFVSELGRLFAAREPEVRQKLEQNTALSKTIQTLRDEQQKSEERRCELAPQYASLNDEILNAEQVVGQLVSDIETQKREFNSLETSTVSVVSVIEGKKQSIQQLREAVDVQLRDARSGIAECDAKQVTNLRLSITPPAKVKTLMEGVCLLLGERPEKNVRGSLTPDYWTLSRRLMEDPMFVERLIAVDPNTDDMPSTDDLQPIVEVCENNRFTSFSALTQALADWLLVMTMAVRYKADIEGLESEVQGGQEDVMRMVEGLEIKRDALSTMQKNLSSQRSNVEKLRRNRDRIGEDLSKFETRLSNASRVVKLVSALSDQYNREYLQAKRQGECLVGDVFLTALSVSTLISLSSGDYDSALTSAKQVLKEHEVEFSEDFDVRRSLQPDTPLLKHEVRGYSLPKQLVDALTALRCRAFPLWPFFVTRFETVADCIEQEVRAAFPNVVVASYWAPNADEIVAAAMEKGYSCIVTDVFGPPPASWRRLFDVATLLRDSEHEGDFPVQVTFSGRQMFVHRQFQLLFIATKSPPIEMIELVSVVPCDANSQAVVAEVVAQRLLTARPMQDSTANTTFAAEMRDLQRLEGRRLNSRDAVSLLIRSHCAELVTDSSLIDQLDEQITSYIRATNSGGNISGRAVTLDAERREPVALISSLANVLFDCLETISKVLSTAFAVCVPAFVDLVDRAYTLNRSVTSQVAAAKLRGLTAAEEQRIVASSFVHSVIDLFSPGIPISFRPVFFAFMSVAACSHELFESKRTTTWRETDYINMRSALSKFSDSSESMRSQPDADADTNSAQISTSDMLVSIVSVEPDEMDSSVNKFCRALSNNNQQNLIALSHAVVTDHGAWLLLRRDESAADSMRDFRVELKHPMHFAEATGHPLSIDTSECGEGTAISLIRRRAYAELFAIEVQHAVDGGYERKIADRVETLVAATCEVEDESAVKKTKGTWHVVVIRNTRQSCNAAELAIARLHKLQRQKKFSRTRNTTYQLWFVFSHGQAADSSTLSTTPEGSDPSDEDDKAAGKPRAVLWMPLLEYCVHVSVAPASPRDHVAAMITVGPAYAREWRNGIGSSVGRLACGLTLLHAALIERQRLGVMGFSYRTAFDDGDLSLLFGLFRLCFSEREGDNVLSVEKPHAMMRYAAMFIYGLRVQNNSDRRILGRLISHFVSEESADASYRFAGLVPADEGDLYDMNQRYVAPSDSGLRELSLISRSIHQPHWPLAAFYVFQLLLDRSTAFASSRRFVGGGTQRTLSARGLRRDTPITSESPRTPTPPTDDRPTKRFPLKTDVTKAKMLLVAGHQHFASALWRVERSLAVMVALNETKASEYVRFKTMRSIKSRSTSRPHLARTAKLAGNEHHLTYMKRSAACQESLFRETISSVRRVWLPALALPSVFLRTWIHHMSSILNVGPDAVPQPVVVLAESTAELQDTDLVLENASFCANGDISAAAQSLPTCIVAIRVEKRAIDPLRDGSLADFTSVVGFFPHDIDDAFEILGDAKSHRSSLIPGSEPQKHHPLDGMFTAILLTTTRLDEHLVQSRIHNFGMCFVDSFPLRVLRSATQRHVVRDRPPADLATMVSVVAHPAATSIFSSNVEFEQELGENAGGIGIHFSVVVPF